ncbi:MarR family winged helix-turn-helix transcriptional regulator [Cohaesibacter gelatinilyticus]|uniref:MarR family protein n=1 Tax=Cohaesibacter gelatinilyticus TaxID=372072 RepID=A0A285PBR8_9HYPH|nr:MarR family winged helix-turn-helix transcriptional regulator [Cohaesibacter gelatinilyticus]SNZ19184.1 MarR family protein [Cohaesibacter gelatinilyticus]HAT87937.1 MarR family transcriptional regulator [Hyphomicrobiales bacterium]
MVKKVDDIRIDHIGWRLWDAAAVWKEKFAAEMVAAGHDWYQEARSSVVPYVGMNGTRQADIVARMGLSKQAVQQLIVDLERSDILRRDPDPDDGRGKIVRFTEKGLASQRDSKKAKKKVEDEIRSVLGDEEFDHLMTVLKKIGSDA